MPTRSVKKTHVRRPYHDAQQEDDSAVFVPACVDLEASGWLRQHRLQEEAKRLLSHLDADAMTDMGGTVTTSRSSERKQLLLFYALHHDDGLRIDENRSAR